MTVRNGVRWGCWVAVLWLTGPWLWVGGGAAADSSPAAPRPIQLEKLTYEVVTLDDAGREVRRERKWNWGFREALGNGVTLEMLLIPGGEFVMGDGIDTVPFPFPCHKVRVKAFFLGRYEVTERQWREVAGWGRVERGLPRRPGAWLPFGSRHDEWPVRRVTWEESMEFCERLRRATGRGYRLPSEAEWEYACRAGTTTAFHFGNSINHCVARFRLRGCGRGAYGEGEFEARPAAVGSHGVANEWGLADMHGNVEEWCEDIEHLGYEGAPTDGRAWVEIVRPCNERKRISRGGSWLSLAIQCRSAGRGSAYSNRREKDTGLRVAMDVPVGLALPPRP
ncbi:MAG: formylglycine-generating enzyme family protein [Chloracidobacterium sp.]|nr:formylglycine-generating enzyme family protein [Chloracidobacterium sp.]MDW8217671.1 formylglycine-generating enzyme family protein [Acidobacteriota bacterium]